MILDVLWSGAFAQIRYSISEEVEDGTVVGNIAKDLGLDKSALQDRGYRIVAGSAEPLFQVNQNDGVLYVKGRIDREEVCERTSPCLIQLKTVLENPLEIHYVAVEILDINDHSPVFPEKEKRLEISESALAGARFQLQAARDNDVGQFSIQQYRLSHNEYFRVEVKDRGEDRKMPFLVLQKQLDREAAGKHKLRLTAVDGGKPVKSGNIEIIVEVLDVNDNSPVFTKELFSATLNENVPVGTVVIQVNANDSDQASDSGTPSLSSNVTVNVFILDQNDNAPVILYPVSSNGSAEGVEEIPRNEVTDHSLFGLDRYTGQIRTLRSFTETDEAEHKLLILVKDNGNVSLSATATVIVKVVEPKEAFAASDFHVVASDSGTPSLSSNVTVNVFILDQNDNTPVILYPVSSNGSAEGVEEIPRNVNAGHLVTKVRAYDADMGYNGWLLFSLQEVTDHSLFGLDRYTGQIRTLRSFTETDEAEHKLLILVKDNGNVSLSATATVIVKVVEPKEAFAASDVKSSTKADEDNNVTFYLMITVGTVSALFLVSIIVLISMQCSKSTDYTSKYLPEPNYDGTLCHSIQYRSGDKRYMLVGPRMSIGSTIVPGSHANTLMLPDRRGMSGEVFVNI
ncbi:protocadherin alpha-10-like [Limanda limanda]|uniref:protocadherin alpha-10-like n=1 Tax=Limanda limanda TaxID=27771 RepID=UPI0029C8BD89|nr:protocadherin alpha-10-like [Limanda limanda]